MSIEARLDVNVARGRPSYQVSTFSDLQLRLLIMPDTLMTAITARTCFMDPVRIPIRLQTRGGRSTCECHCTSTASNSPTETHLEVCYLPCHFTFTQGQVYGGRAVAAPVTVTEKNNEGKKEIGESSALYTYREISRRLLIPLLTIVHVVWCSFSRLTMQWCTSAVTNFSVELLLSST